MLSANGLYIVRTSVLSLAVAAKIVRMFTVKMDFTPSRFRFVVCPTIIAPRHDHGIHSRASVNYSAYFIQRAKYSKLIVI